MFGEFQQWQNRTEILHDEIIAAPVRAMSATLDRHAQFHFQGSTADLRLVPYPRQQPPSTDGQSLDSWASDYEGMAHHAGHRNLNE